MQLIQVAATPGSLRPMTDAMFAADRGYNAMETINFSNESLGATDIGTQMRSLDFPFVFGEGPIRRRHKRMTVSEKERRAVYSATCHPTGHERGNIQAVVYRESYTGGIAAIYHNDQQLLSAHSFGLIPKNGYRQSFQAAELNQIREVYRSGRSVKRAAANDTFLPLMKVSLALNKVEHLTILLSEDPGWFLARAFRFTSRTMQVFLKTFASDYDRYIKGLAGTLRRKGVTSIAEPLPADFTGAEAILRGK